MTAALVALLLVAALAKGAEEERPATNSPKFISSGGARQVKEGDDVELLCDVDDLGEFVLLWKFNRSLVLFAGNLRIHRDDRIARDDLKGSLLIRQFRPENAGEYTCQVSTNPPQDITYHVHVLGPPRILAQPQADVVVKRGQPLALTCQADEAEVTWRRDAHVLHRGTELRVLAATPEDSGHVECVANNALGESRHAFTVRVLYAPEMEEKEEQLVHAPLGTEVRLECRFRSEPAAAVTWSRGPKSNPQRVMPDQHVRIETQRNQSALVLPSVTRALYDLYTCAANNSLGAAHALFHVTGRPSRPLFESPPLMGRAQEARLEWRVRSEAPITKYSVRVRQLDAGEWREFDFRPETEAVAGERRDAFLVPGLEADQRYEAQVWAENEFGVTQSHVFAFVTSGSWRASPMASLVASLVASSLLVHVVVAHV